VRLATPATLPGVNGRPMTACAWSAAMVRPEVLDASIEKGIAESVVAIAQTSVIVFDILIMIDSLVSRKPEGRTINDHSVFFESAQ
jgi:hypothetical protein